MNGFPGYARFFGTMQFRYWDLLESLNSLMPLRHEFCRDYLRAEPTQPNKTVNTWLFRGYLNGLITGNEYHFLSGMIGTR